MTGGCDKRSIEAVAAFCRVSIVLLRFDRGAVVATALRLMYSSTRLTMETPRKKRDRFQSATQQRLATTIALAATTRFVSRRSVGF